MLADRFYLLVLDEIEAQPNLARELKGVEIADIAIKVTGVALPKAVELLTNPAVGWGTEQVIKAVRQLGSPPKSVLRDLGELLAIFKSSVDNYNALCRSALLHLLWQEPDEAERKVNVAKNNHDEWAFAHHVYGLVRGMQDNAEGARFELHLARERETLHAARERIERALAVTGITT